MKVNQDIRPASALLAIEDKINLNPMWQRGPVWSPERQSLLIDSILREMDIPKIYLLRCEAGGPWEFEAVDGQQRLRALFTFRQDQLRLNSGKKPLPPIDGHEIQGRTFSELPEALQERFSNFPLCVAEVEPTGYDDIRTLFLRLQMGMPLTPAELRNSMNGPLRQVVDLMGRTHPIFAAARIGSARDKRQDYLAHVFTLLANPGKTDLKAPDLLRDYETMEGDQVQALAPQVLEVLDTLAAAQSLAPFKMSQKWIFVDLAWIVAERFAAGEAVDPAALARAYSTFERRRREFNARPAELLEGEPSAADQALYRYINAFVASGADRTRLNARHEALKILLADVEPS